MQNDNNKKNALLILFNLVNIMISLLSLSEIVNEKSKFQCFFFFLFFSPSNKLCHFLDQKDWFFLCKFWIILLIFWKCFWSNFQYQKNKNMMRIYWFFEKRILLSLFSIIVTGQQFIFFQKFDIKNWWIFPERKISQIHT